MLLRVLYGEDGQQEDINEATDEEAKEGGIVKWARLRAWHDFWWMGIASMKVIRYGLSFKAIQRKRSK